MGKLLLEHSAVTLKPGKAVIKFQFQYWALERLFSSVLQWKKDLSVVCNRRSYDIANESIQKCLSKLY
jgi:hypothetical protein